MGILVFTGAVAEAAVSTIEGGQGSGPGPGQQADPDARAPSAWVCSEQAVGRWLLGLPGLCVSSVTRVVLLQCLSTLGLR